MTGYGWPKFCVVQHFSDTVIMILVAALLMTVCSAGCQGEVHNVSSQNCSLDDRSSEKMVSQTDLESQKMDDHVGVTELIQLRPEKDKDPNLSKTNVQFVDSRDRHPPFNSEMVDIYRNLQDTTVSQVVEVMTADPSLPDYTHASTVLAQSPKTYGLAPAGAKTGGYNANAVAASIRREDDDDDVGKVVGVVVPFICAIFIAVALFAACKLCRRHRCYNKDVRLQKCMLLCKVCLSTPDVFRGHGNSRDQKEYPSTSAKLSYQPVNSLSCAFAGKISASTPSLSSNRCHGTYHYTISSGHYHVGSLRPNVSRQNSTNSHTHSVWHAAVGGQKTTNNCQALRTSQSLSTIHQNSSRHQNCSRLHVQTS